MSVGKLMQGQRFDEQRNLVIPFTEQVEDWRTADPQVGNARTEIQPIDHESSRVRIWGGSGTIPALETTAFSFAGFTRLNLPPVLTGITVTYNVTSGDGESIHEAGAAESAGTSGGLNFDPSSSAQASAAVIPDIQPAISQANGDNVPTIIDLFYIQGNVTQVAVLTRLTAIHGATVNAYPDFRPKTHIFTLTGQQVSLSQSADSHHSDRWSTDNLSWAISPFDGSRSDGKSIEVGATTRTIQLPPTIHGSITLSNTSHDEDVTVTVVADIPEITGTGIAPSFSAVTNEPTPVTATASGAVSPTSLSSTGGDTAIPTSGLYLVELDCEPYGYGYTTVRAVVVNFANVH